MPKIRSDYAVYPREDLGVSSYISNGNVLVFSPLGSWLVEWLRPRLHNQSKWNDIKTKIETMLTLTLLWNSRWQPSKRKPETVHKTPSEQHYQRPAKIVVLSNQRKTTIEDNNKYLKVLSMSSTSVCFHFDVSVQCAACVECSYSVSKLIEWNLSTWVDQPQLLSACVDPNLYNYLFTSVKPWLFFVKEKFHERQWRALSLVI